MEGKLTTMLNKREVYPDFVKDETAVRTLDNIRGLCDYAHERQEENIHIKIFCESSRVCKVRLLWDSYCDDNRIACQIIGIDFESSWFKTMVQTAVLTPVEYFASRVKFLDRLHKRAILLKIKRK